MEAGLEDNEIPHQREEVSLQDLSKAKPSEFIRTPESELTVSNVPSSPQPESESDGPGAEKTTSSKLKKWMDKKKILCLASIVMADMMINVQMSLSPSFYPEEAKKKGVSLPVISAVMSISSLLMVILSPILGYLVNFIGVRVMIPVGLLLLGLSCLLRGFIAFIPITGLFIFFSFFGALLDGVGSCMYTIAVYSLVPALFPVSLGTVMGIIQIADGTGFILGSALAAGLYQAGGYILPFIFTGVLLLITVIPNILWIRNISTGIKKKIPLKVALRIVTVVMFILLVASNLTAGGATSFLFPTLELYIIKNFHFSPSIVSLTYLIFALSFLIFSVPIGLISDKTKNRKIFIISGLFITVLGYFLISIPAYTGQPHYWYIAVGFTLISFGRVCATVTTYPEMIKISAKYATEEHGEDTITPFISGIYGSFLSLGSFLGGLLGGAITSVLSFPLTSLLFASFILAQTIMILAVALIDRFV